jgi:peptide/nickel transport system ATP-binding protein
MTGGAAAGPPALLEIEGLRVGIHTQAGLLRAVDGVDLAVAPGEIVGIVGESGSGKSVMALSVLRLLEARQTVEGAIRFEGEELLAMPEPRLQQLRGGRIAIVLQDPMTSLNPVLRVGDQLVEGILCHGRVARDEAARRVVRLLGEMGLTAPDEAMRRYPHQFSGGMRQRIMLAMGFGNSPALLIADEPTTALDVTIQAQILELLRRLNGEFGTAIMLITHDLGVVANLCSRIAVMYAGRIVEEGPAEPILADPRHPYTQALVGAVPRIDRDVRRGRPLAMIGGAPPNPLDGFAGCAFQARCPRRVERCAERPAMRPIGPGRAAACWLADDPRPVAAAAAGTASQPVPAPDRQAAPLLELRQATKHFPVGRRWLAWSGPGRVVHALDEVSLDVWPGETLGLVGESGSGKSTLARLAVGLSRLTAGEIRFAGEEIGRASAGRLRRLRRDLQMIFQDPYSSLNPRLTVGSAIAEPLRLQRRVATPRQAARRAAELLGEVGLGSEAAGRYPHEFSGGQRQRIGIARALAAEPRLIVADEPISSLDVNVQAQILNLLLDLQAEHRLTYVFISHNLAVVRQIAHRIVVLYLGQVVEVAETDRIFEQPLHPYTRALIAAVPVPDAAVERARPGRPLGGEMPSVIDPPSGCRFRTRCPIAQPVCAAVPPPLAMLAPGQAAACHFPGQG